MYVHKQLIMKVPFFQDCDDAFIKTVRLKTKQKLRSQCLAKQPSLIIVVISHNTFLYFISLLDCYFCNHIFQINPNNVF